MAQRAHRARREGVARFGPSISLTRERPLPQEDPVSRSLKIAFGIIGVVFVIFFVAMYHFVKTAFDVYEPPVEERYYEKGLDYQKRVSEFERARAAGWSMQVNVFEGKSVKKGANLLRIVLVRDASIKQPEAAAQDPGRLAAHVTVSHRASLKGGRSYDFRLSDFQKRSADHMELEQTMDVPLSGRVEVTVEARPSADSAIFATRTLDVE